jgi:hypothetical protein
MEKPPLIYIYIYKPSIYKRERDRESDRRKQTIKRELNSM